MSKESEYCTKNCYAIVALCVSFLTLGLLIGNWVGKCTKNSKNCNVKKCKSKYIDGTSGSTCNWSEYNKKNINSDCVKSCCNKKY